MFKHRTEHLLRTLPILLISALVLGSAACSINVKDKHNSSDDKKVDIETPLGGIHVSEGADVRDTGLSVYPGARPRKKDSGDNEKSANVNIAGPGFALKVVALEYESDDSPDKIVTYYKDQLKKFGNVLECRTEKRGGDVGSVSTKGGNDSEPVTCDSNNQGSTIELKVGQRNDQHIVAIEPSGKGARLALVYVRTRGKQETI